MSPTANRTREVPRDVLAGDEAALEAIRRGEHADPHRILGRHAVRVGRSRGTVLRVFHPDAEAAECVVADGSEQLEALGSGVFAAFFRGSGILDGYRLRFRFPDGSTWEREDPYRFPPTVGEQDLYLFGEGSHRRLWERLGAHPLEIEGVRGVSFAVWAPNARRVSVVGEFCGWDGRLLPMRQLGVSGVWELFVPGLEAGAFYKYEILTQAGQLRLKSDPFAFWMESAGGGAARVFDLQRYAWGDEAWMSRRAERRPAREPMAIYEAHLGSWARVPEEGNRYLTYREIAPRLAAHVKRFGFTHVELLPVMEHPFDGSWGYQVTGYYAPTSRFGDPDDFRFLVDTLHQEGVGVILDWVPAHFPKDDFALRRFDGDPLYEHADPRLGEHPDWGTLVFDFGRREVRNFLVANALYWLREFHVDGLRVDAVASMLYLDYSRKEGEWVPNRYGGRENLEAIEFLRAVNAIVGEEMPGALTIAEESTAWPGVTRPAEAGGLGFSFKWNMGWMHDTLAFFEQDPIHRKYHQDRLTFAMLYEYSERFVMPLSHDEVVHLKGSLLHKMAGDFWQKLANLRLLLTYQYTRPGKVLLFMGSELAPDREWNHDASLDWHLAEQPERAAFGRFYEELGRLYRESPSLWRSDHEPDGFSWIDCNDRDNSVISYIRRDGDDHLVVVFNLTPLSRESYRIGVPSAGAYVERFSSDDPKFGGSQVETPKRIETEPSAFHGHPQSVRLVLPPLAALVLAPER